jgi:hypothetical protein
MRIDGFIAVSLVVVSLASSSIPNTSQRETVFEATVLNAFVSLFFFDDDAVNVVGFRMLRTARLFLFVVLNSVVKAWAFLDKDKDGAFNDDSRMRVVEIFLLVKFYSFECNTRGQCTTHARAILNAHIKTRAHESSAALKIHP